MSGDHSGSNEVMLDMIKAPMTHYEINISLASMIKVLYNCYEYTEYLYLAGFV